MTATPNFASDARADVGAGNTAAPAANAGPFVLNLCSSTTPMALAQTDLPELKRFTFFVSRRFEEGRERFRLHMGYFATLAEAEEWLNVVREIYPGAWAGEAPGRKLRERAAAAAAAQAQHAAGPQQHIAVSPRAPAPAVMRAPTRSPAEPMAGRVPVLQAAPGIARATAAVVAKPAVKIAAPVAAPATQVAASRKAPPVAPATPVRTPPVVSAPRATRGVAQPAQPFAPRAAVQAGEKSEKNSPGVFGDSNVREVLKALGDASATGETRLMRVPPPPREAPAPKSALSDTQVLKLLEVRRPEGGEQPQADPAHSAIPLLNPDDTGTRETLKDAVVSNAAVLFAVQLQWSVQAVELDKVPPLAIFSAYTLYTVEGSRDGRKWYGLRLGFFSDAISAKQVAHYVRSEFASVAVVPVSAQEKSRATDQDKQAATLGSPVTSPTEPEDEFKLFDDTAAAAAAAVPKLLTRAPASVTDAAGSKIPGRPVPKVAVGRTVRQPAAAAPAVAPGVPAVAAAKGRTRGGAKVGARERRGAQTLEETLEILGASELTIDDGKGETLNESGVRHLRVEVQKDSPFSKLLERLSERMKKP